MIARIVRNVASLLAGHVISKIFSLLCIIFLAKRLGVDGFGTYGTIMAYLTLFATFADNGLVPVITRDLSQNHARSDELFSHALVLRMLLAGIFYSALCIVGYVGRNNEFSLLFIMAGSLFLFPETIRKLGISMLSGFERMDLVAGLEVLGSVLRYFPLLLAIVLGASFQTAFLVFIAAWGVLALIWLLVIRYYCLQSHSVRIDFDKLRGLLYEAFPFGIVSILSIIYFKADILMLSKMQGVVAVGFYEGAYKFIEASMFIPTSLVNVLLPVMSRTFVSDKHSYANIYTHATRILAMSILPFVIVASFFTKEIILLIYNDEYLPSASALLLLLWALFIIFLNAPVGNVIASSKRMHAFLPFAIGNTLMNIVLNFLLIPKYSFLGASFATLLTECVSFIIHLYFIKRIMGGISQLIGLVAKLFLAGLITWLVGYFSIPALIFPLNIVPVLSVYLLSVVVLKLIDRQDKQICLELLRMIKTKL